MKKQLFLILTCVIFGCTPKYKSLNPMPKGIDQNTLPIPTLDEIVGTYGYDGGFEDEEYVINADSTYRKNYVDCGGYSTEHGHFTRKNRALVFYADSSAILNSKDFIYNRTVGDSTSKWVFKGFGNKKVTLSKNIKWGESDTQTSFLYDKNGIHMTSTNQKNVYITHFAKDVKPLLGHWVLVEK